MIEAWRNHLDGSHSVGIILTKHNRAPFFSHTSYNVSQKGISWGSVCPGLACESPNLILDDDTKCEKVQRLGYLFKVLLITVTGQSVLFC